MAEEQQATGRGQTYRVLARKYRPQDFSTLVGQEPMVRTLTNAFESGRIAQAWMLTGVRGVGKTTTARILARALNYKTPEIDRPSINLEPIGEHCQAIMEGHHIDIIEMDAASHTGIDDIRDIIEQSRYRPQLARYKVYIIDEVHMLSTQAFNGLLKTLEEPPPHVKFIFATTEIRKVPITILSRCQRFDLRRVSTTTLKAHLAKIAALEGIEAQDEALGLIARAGEGSVRDALSMLDQAIAHGLGRVEVEPVRAMLGLADRSRIIELFDNVMRGDVASALTLYKNLYDEGAEPHVLITEMAEFVHIVTRLRFTPQWGEDGELSEEEWQRGLQFAKGLNLRILSQSWQMLLKGLNEIDGAPNPYQAGDMLLVRLSHAAWLPPLDEVLKQVEEQAALENKTQGQEITGNNKAGAEEKGRGKDVAPDDKKEQQTPQLNVKIETQSVEEINQDNVSLENFTDILAHADKLRDLSFKTHLKEYVRPINIGHGMFEFSPTNEAPRHLSNLIAKTLQNWTGERWTVISNPDKGGMTINEQEQARRESLLSDAASDPDIVAILAQFPQARIVDVRLNAIDETEDNLELENDGEVIDEG